MFPVYKGGGGVGSELKVVVPGMGRSGKQCMYCWGLRHLQQEGLSLTGSESFD